MKPERRAELRAFAAEYPDSVLIVSSSELTEILDALDAAEEEARFFDAERCRVVYEELEPALEKIEALTKELEASRDYWREKPREQEGNRQMIKENTLQELEPIVHELNEAMEEIDDHIKDWEKRLRDMGLETYYTLADSIGTHLGLRWFLSFSQTRNGTWVLAVKTKSGSPYPLVDCPRTLRIKALPHLERLARGLKDQLQAELQYLKSKKSNSPVQNPMTPAELEISQCWEIFGGRQEGVSLVTAVWNLARAGDAACEYLVKHPLSSTELLLKKIRAALKAETESDAQT